MRFASVFFTLFASAALGAEVGDDAISECQKRHSDFSEVQTCLAPTHIALAMLQAAQSEEHYGEAISDVIAGCETYHQASVRIWTCTRSRLRQADTLLEMVKDPSKIEDPVFAVLAKPGAFAAITSREQQMKEEFSDQILMPYHP